MNEIDEADNETYAIGKRLLEFLYCGGHPLDSQMVGETLRSRILKFLQVCSGDLRSDVIVTHQRNTTVRAAKTEVVKAYLGLVMSRKIPRPAINRWGTVWRAARRVLGGLILCGGQWRRMLDDTADFAPDIEVVPGAAGLEGDENYAREMWTRYNLTRKFFEDHSAIVHLFLYLITTGPQQLVSLFLFSNDCGR